VLGPPADRGAGHTTSSLGDELTDEEPRLYPSGSELYQHTQALLAILALSSRIRGHWQARLEKDGRLAHSDDEHAELLHLARQLPPVRLMSEAEEREWLDRIPPTQSATPSATGELTDRTQESISSDGASERPDAGPEFSVWTGQLGTAWAVEARGGRLETGQSVAARVVCRNGDDAIALCRWLRDHQRPENILELRAIAGGGLKGSVTQPDATSPTHATATTADAVLTEEEWESALRGVLPVRLADQIIVKNSNHPHHTAWRELWQLAATEVARVGADPHHLAQIVHTVPTWRDDIRKPPALAHWAISEARSSAGYERAVHGESTAPGSSPAMDHEATPEQGPRLGLERVHTHADAVRWARALDTTNPVHRAEARHGFGRWGSSVDAILTRKFPDLLDIVSLRRRPATAQPGRSTTDSSVDVLVHTGADDPVVAAERHAEARLSPSGAADLRKYVRDLDPDRAGDRLAAIAMFGHGTPEADLILVDRFGDDPRLARKVLDTYPDGLPDAEAWRARATAGEQYGAVVMTTPDDPSTARREDLDGHAAATAERRTAEHQHAAAGAVERPVVETAPAGASGPTRSPTAPPAGPVLRGRPRR
jgi:hypothetical protein